uniref:SVWC domain-containing protein n=1 Tax=Glossina pallidipes TaxID=7398 RepID=A0A1B0A1Q9_GLOPL
MKLIIYAFVILASISIILASRSIQFFQDPEYPGKCVINENIILSPGEEISTSDICGLIKCAHFGVAFITGCTAQGVHPSCKILDYVDAKTSFALMWIYKTNKSAVMAMATNA